jgi:hypothetical protein
MSPFIDEVDKVARATEAVTSRWKIWGVGIICIGAVLLLLVVAFKCCG